jgi:HSP20 family protein
MAATELAKREEEKAVPRPWEPFRFITEMEHEVERLFAEPFYTWPRLLTRFPRFTPVLPDLLMPRVDVYEKEGYLVVKAELPGMKKEEIEVELEEGDLVIKGERKAEQEAFYRMERFYGRFYRRIPLPAEVKPEEIKATYKEGILEVHIPVPKADKLEVKKVKIA